MSRIKNSDAIACFLNNYGVSCVFGYQGSNISHLIDSLAKNEIHYVQNYHEQAAAFAACSYAQVKDCLGVAVASSGPGAINLINGIANAYYDSIPVLFITGNSSIDGAGVKHNCRQRSFQETDIVSIVKPITKYAVKITDPDSTLAEFDKAIDIAMEGRRGPVLVDLPHNIQNSTISTVAHKSSNSNYRKCTKPLCEVDFQKIVHLLNRAKRPLILLGGGASGLRNSGIIEELLAKLHVPAVASLLGIDVVAHNDEHYYGFIGSYGVRWANLAVACCDVLLVLGSRLDDNQTGQIVDEFAPHAQIIHVDIDETELGWKLPREISVNQDVKEFLLELLPLLQKRDEYSSWNDSLRKWKTDFSEKSNASSDSIHCLIDYITSKASAGTVFTEDVGQNQMWVAQSAVVNKGNRLINSGGLGSMGYSLPAAIGASFAAENPVICFAGDGGFQMNIQELQTIVKYKLPIKIVLFNDSTLGMIRVYQNKALNGRLVGTKDTRLNPSFKAIANAYGISYCCSNSTSVESFVNEHIDNQEPVIYEIILDDESVVLPAPAYKQAVYNQEPLLPSEILDIIIRKACED